MIGAILLSLLLVADTPDRDRQRHRLYTYREAWSAASEQRVRDSIIREVRAAVSDETVHQNDANEQLYLWEMCCPLWDVEEISDSVLSINTFNQLRYSTVEIEGVTFYRFDSTYSKSSDTMYTASNDVPGYGGIDIHYSYLKFSPAIQASRWIPQNNIGLGINTGADEFGFSRVDTVITFYRLQHNTIRKYRAFPRNVLYHVSLSKTHSSIPLVYVSAQDCRGNTITAAALDHTTTFDVPSSAASLVFTCCRTSPQRTFSRCSGHDRELDLQPTDIRSHICESETSPQSQHDSVEVFSFSIYEDHSSAVAALQNVLKLILKEGRYVSRVHVEAAPNHLTEQLSCMISELTSQQITAHITKSTAPRTSIVVQRRR